MLLLLVSLFACILHGFTIPTSLDPKQVALQDSDNSELVAWIDPRINGGRFLDVSSRSMSKMELLMSLIVHNPEIWRTFERYH